MESFDFIVVPICVTNRRHSTSAEAYKHISGQHWMLLAADVMQKTVTIINSVPNARNYAVAEERHLEYFRFLCQLFMLYIRSISFYDD